MVPQVLAHMSTRHPLATPENEKKKRKEDCLRESVYFLFFMIHGIRVAKHSEGNIEQIPLTA